MDIVKIPFLGMLWLVFGLFGSYLYWCKPERFLPHELKSKKIGAIVLFLTGIVYLLLTIYGLLEAGTPIALVLFMLLNYPLYHVLQDLRAKK